MRLPSGSLAPEVPGGLLLASEAEKPVDGEDQKIEQMVSMVKEIVSKNNAEHGHAQRATHVKTRALLRGELIIKSDLPDWQKVGLFAQSGKTYPVAARVAIEPSHILKDTEKAPRGLGLKIFDVEGKFMEGSEGTTQDLHFNNAPMLELTDLDTAVEIFTLRLKHFENPEELKKDLLKRSDSTKQLAPGTLPNTHLMSQTMYTQSAFAHGQYIAHYGLFPAEDQVALGQSSISSDASPDAHKELLQDFFSSRSATYTLKAQFSSSLTQHPVEDAAVVWPESSAPWFELGTLTFPKQESFSDARLEWWEDHIALTPYNGLEAHRPLGSVNRLRKRVYQESRDKRAALNGKEVHFPSDISEMPQ